MNKQFVTTAFVAALTFIFCASANASVIDRIGISAVNTSQGRTINFGDQFFQGSDLRDGDPITSLVKYGFPSFNPPADETVYIGRARYSVNVNSSQMNQGFFYNLEAFSYLLGPSSQLKLMSLNPYRLSCKKSVMLGISVESQQSIVVWEANQLPSNPRLAAIVKQLNARSTSPERVVVQSFSNFSDYFDLGMMLTMIYNDGQAGTSVDLVSVSVIHTVPPLIGRSFIRNTSKNDLFYYVDHLSYLENRR